MTTSLKERYIKFLGNGSFSRLIKEQNSFPKSKFIRINQSKTTPNETSQFLKSHRFKTSETFIKNAIKINKSHFNISATLPSLLGKFYLQDLASQIPINCLKLPKKSTLKILDMAAAPGSKTTQLADLLNYKKINYQITATEPSKLRIKKLINNIQKQNFKNIKIINSKAQDFKTNSKFDIILLDAPCSGNFIADKSWLKKRTIEGIKQKSKIQKELLLKATKLLAKNGILVYSTCSLEPEENEENVKFILKNSKLKLITPNFSFPFNTKPLDNSISQAIRLTPYISKTQGFFIAIFQS